MARNETQELLEQINQMRALLEQHGIRPAPRVVPAEERADYVPHGSDTHARLLGLVEVMDGDPDRDLYVTYTSPATHRTWRLYDEMEANRHFPAIDPDKAAKMLLRQKINELEQAPRVPADAPPMTRPPLVYG